LLISSGPAITGVCEDRSVARERERERIERALTPNVARTRRERT